MSARAQMACDGTHTRWVGSMHPELAACLRSPCVIEPIPQAPRPANPRCCYRWLAPCCWGAVPMRPRNALMPWPRRSRPRQAPNRIFPPAATRPTPTGTWRRSTPRLLWKSIAAARWTSRTAASTWRNAATSRRRRAVPTTRRCTGSTWCPRAGSRRRSNAARRRHAVPIRGCPTPTCGLGSETLIEPPNRNKGNVARITLYYIEQHGIQIPDEALELYLEWHRKDPVDRAEKKRAKAIEAILGHSNPYVTGER
ncbi:MAG: hypothetical protein EOP91_13075 [Lysobacteraceae bacterium]|nr:MAG: hypothetical protein EOP91_13075 [Xanthomonadaceae bacterium]